MALIATFLSLQFTVYLFESGNRMLGYLEVLGSPH